MNTFVIVYIEFVNRTLVLPYDLGRFDAMVSAHEKEALEYLSGCVPGVYFSFFLSYYIDVTPCERFKIFLSYDGCCTIFLSKVHQQ